MSCYAELIDKIREKHISHEILDELMEYGFSSLAKSDKNSYNSIMQKMENLAYKLTREEAEDIVCEMEPRGEKWTYSQIANFVKGKNIEQDDYVDWYLAMNMAYNDYYPTASNYGLQNDDMFYFHIAHDFIKDEDACPHKVVKYFAG